MSFKRTLERQQKTNQAYNNGFRMGRSQGIRDAMAYYAEKLDRLEEIKGIGETMALRILLHLGYEKKGE